ncbi:IPT/TIG domain-containing protein [Polaribacter sp. R77954]|uniref:IPT/TIG domain-containing protein n=1 Tax=Polaribacter sp. R77954 TaxID=3093870 RepID=UPI0037C68CAA
MVKRIIVLIIVCLFFSCSEEEIYIPPNVVTKGFENLTNGGVRLFGNFNNFSENDEVGFYLFSQNTIFKEYTINPVNGDNSILIETGLYKNREYSYNTFVKTLDTIYVGLSRRFVSTGSKAIVFNKIEPAIGNYLSTVKLYTNSKLENINLSDVEVFFNDKKASILSFEDNALVCEVPYFDKNPTANIKINYLGSNSPTELTFTLSKPEITSITPAEVTFRDKITILGQNFSKDINYLKVYINDIKCDVVINSATDIEVTIPDELNSATLGVRLESNLQEISQSGALTLKKPTISLVPKNINIKELMTIEGANFHPIGYNTKVFLDDNEHFSVNWSNSSWFTTKVGIDVQDAVYKDWTVTGKVVVADNLESTAFEVTILDPIIKIKDSYDDVITDYNCDYNGNKFVFGINSDNQMVFHQFNKNTDEFYNKKTINLPLNRVYSVVYNRGYIYIRNNANEKNHYRINMQNFNIEFLSDFKGNQNATVFYVDENKIIYKYQETYSSQGVDLFEYAIPNNSWNSRTDDTSVTITNVFYNTYGKTYFLEGIYSAITDIYTFDGSTFKKSNVELQTGFKDYYPKVIFDDDKFYFIEKSGAIRKGNKMMILDMTTNQWTEYKDFLFDSLDFTNTFKVDNYIYLESVNTSNYKRNLYKLDLNKL